MAREEGKKEPGTGESAVVSPADPTGVCLQSLAPGVGVSPFYWGAGQAVGDRTVRQVAGGPVGPGAAGIQSLPTLIS